MDDDVEKVDIRGFKLQRTCWACPEQYDVWMGDKQVGYLRLRHGFFRADYPDCGGETVYEATPKGDGLFEADEREHYLTEAVAAIAFRIATGHAPKVTVEKLPEWD